MTGESPEDPGSGGLEAARASAAALFSLLRGRGLKLALAESCTGGLASSLFTDIPGASSALWGGFVVYSEEAKERLLGVDPATIRDKGVVSRETALAMARGALARSGADLAAAVTGYAGPEAGPGEAAPGRVCLAWAFRAGAAASAQAAADGPASTLPAPLEASAEERYAGDRTAVRLKAAERLFDGAARLAARASGGGRY